MTGLLKEQTFLVQKNKNQEEQASKQEDYCQSPIAQETRILPSSTYDTQEKPQPLTRNLHPEAVEKIKGIHLRKQGGEICTGEEKNR
jgi:hypothetical protein